MKLSVGTKGLIRYNNKVLVLREAQYDEGTEAGKWDVPGGRIEPHERLFEGLAREIKEESGLDITPGRVLGVFETFPTIKGEACHIVRIYYECIAESDHVTLGSDHDTCEWIDPASYESRDFVSDIEEMLSVISKGE